MSVPFRTPLRHLHCLCVFTLGFKNQTLPMQCLRVIWTLLQSPVIIDICLVKIAHFLEARCHIITKLSFEQFKVL